MRGRPTGMATPAGPWKSGPYWMMIEVRYRKEVTKKLYATILIEIFSLKFKARAIIVRIKKRFPICQSIPPFIKILDSGFANYTENYCIVGFISYEC